MFIDYFKDQIAQNEPNDGDYLKGRTREQALSDLQTFILHPITYQRVHVDRGFRLDGLIREHAKHKGEYRLMFMDISKESNAVYRLVWESELEEFMNNNAFTFVRMHNTLPMFKNN